MRISSTLYHQNTIRNIQQATEDYSKLSVQMATNQRITRPSDDPLGTVSLLTLDAQLEDLNQYQRNIDNVHFSLGQQETQISGIVDQLFSVQGIVTQAANGTTGTTELEAYEQELAVLIDGVINLLNAQDGAGRYYFSGSELNTPPFQQDPTTGLYSYQGDSHVREVPVSNNANVASNILGSDIDPSATFLNELVAYQDALANPGSYDVGTESRNLLPEISNFLARLNSSLTQIGGIRSSIEGLETANVDIAEFTQELRDEMSSVDYAESYIRMNESLAAYESTLRVYSSVSELSLFSFI